MKAIPIKTQFLMDEETGVFAYFPDIHHAYYEESIYHAGSHAKCSAETAAASRIATPTEYEYLKAELEGKGYILELKQPPTT